LDLRVTVDGTVPIYHPKVDRMVIASIDHPKVDRMVMASMIMVGS
jgi:hypothetical protein